MQIFCTQEFKVEFEKLISRKQYSTLQEDIINYFFDKKISQLLSGANLNNSTDTPYLKKRLRGSGGYRIYFLILIKDENAYLMFVHPKTGPYGADNINDKSKAYLYKNTLEAIKTNQLFKLEVSKSKGNIILFNRL
jgi:hypothetical protein